MRTAYWFGFVVLPDRLRRPRDRRDHRHAHSTGVGWPPFDALLTTRSRSRTLCRAQRLGDRRTVFVGQGDATGNFDIQNVPAGTYTLSIWDEQLSYIIRFLPVTVGDGAVDVELGRRRRLALVRLALRRRLLRREQEPGPRPRRARRPEHGVDQRWRDGSIKEETVHRRRPATTSTRQPKGARSASGSSASRASGASVSAAPRSTTSSTRRSSTPLPTNLGGALLDQPAPHRGPPRRGRLGQVRLPADGENGQIVGITFWATTRNEFDARFQAGESYEPGIPDVSVQPRGPRRGQRT